MAMLFGKEDDLGCIVDVPLRGPANEELCLGYRVSMHFFIGGIYAEDEGYILKVKTEDSYYPLPSGDELESYQQEGMLPATLPGYSVPLWDYAFGYSLWIILAVVAVWTGITQQITKRRAARATGAR